MKVVEIARTKKPSGIGDDFYVLGLALPAPTANSLSAAFPRCILHPAGVDLREQIAGLCDLLGRVVLFHYIPSMQAKAWLRVSAVFDQEAVKVIGVHPGCTEDIYNRALEAECSGVIGDDATPEAFFRAAVSVQRGELWFPRSYLSQRTREAVSIASPGNLSEREAGILSLLAGGITNQGIADKLFISRDTVRWHLRSIYAKLGVSDREAALRLARNKMASAPTEQRRTSA